MPWGVAAFHSCVLPNLKTGWDWGLAWPLPQDPGDNPETSLVVRSDRWPAPRGQQPGLILLTAMSPRHLTQGWAPSWPP